MRPPPRLPTARLGRLVAVAIAAGVAGCGTDDDGGGTPDAEPAPVTCQAALSGAVSHTFGGCVAQLTWIESSNASHLELTAPGEPGEPFALRVDVRFVGLPELADRDGSTSTGVLTVTRSDADAGDAEPAAGWRAVAAGPDDGVGSYTLTVTSAAPSGALIAGRRGYLVHGSLVATLPPVADETGDVTVDTRF